MAKVTAAERAVSRTEETIRKESEQATAYEESIPGLKEMLAAAEDKARTGEKTFEEALEVARAARREGGREARLAEADLEVSRDAWVEARRQRWRALATLKRAERGLASAITRRSAAERRLATRRARLAEAVTARDEAIRDRSQAELWVGATNAMVARRFSEALEIEAQIGANADPALASPRAFARCVATEGLAEARVASCKAVGDDLPSAHRHLALAYFVAGRVDEGLPHFARAAIADDDAELRVAAGVALVRAGRPGEALANLEAALGHEPNEADALDALADTYLALERYANALSALERLEAVDPTRDAITYRKARAYAVLGEDEHATVLMSSFVGRGDVGPRDPSYTRCQRDLYRDLLLGGEVELPTVPNKALAHIYLGQRAQLTGESESARDHFETALGLAPDDRDVRLRVGIFRLQSGDLEGAREHLSAIAGEGTDPRARTALGVALSRQGRQTEAIELLSQASRDDAWGQLALGVAQARSGDRASARATWQPLADDPTVGPAARHNLIALSLYAGEDERLATALAGSVATSPEGHLLRGLVALDGGDPGGAMEHLGRALAAQPAYLQAKLAQGRALDRLDQSEAAIARLREAVSIDPGCPDAHVQLGAVLSRAGQGEAARAEYRKAEALFAALKEKKQAELSAQDPATRESAVRRLAVVSFINAQADPKWDWLSFGIAEAVSTDLAQLSSLEVIERGQVASVMREIKFSSLDFVDATTAPKIGKVLSVDALVVGSYQVVGDTIRIDGRLVELGTQRVLESGRAEGPIGDLFALERTLALDLVGRWAKVEDAERTALISAPSGNVSGLEQLALTRIKMLQGDAIGAKKAYREAIERSPELARRVQDMRSAYEDAEARVAILPFRNASRDPEAEWMGVGIAESMATDMRKIGLFVVERTDIARALTEQKFGQLVEPDRAARLGHLVGAQVILIGSYQSLGDLLAIDARMVQVETGAVVLTERISGKSSEFFELQRQLSAAIAKALDLQVGVEELAALVGDEPDLDDFKDTILKDRLFVLHKPSEDSSGGGASLTAPIIVGLGGLAAGITGGVLYGLAEGKAADSDREHTLYRRSVDQAEIEAHYTKARDLNDESNTYRVASYVAFGVAGASVIYSTWALIAAANDKPETRGRAEVVEPKLTPIVAPRAVGVEMRVDF